MIKKLIATAICASAILILSCGKKTTPAKSEATPANTYKKWAMADMSAFHRGGMYYSAYCQNCHKLKDPMQFTEADWKNIMPDMQRKAKIADSTANNILNYVLAIREGVPAPAAAPSFIPGR